MEKEEEEEEEVRKCQRVGLDNETQVVRRLTLVDALRRQHLDACRRTWFGGV